MGAIGYVTVAPAISHLTSRGSEEAGGPDALEQGTYSVWNAIGVKSCR